MGIYCNEFWGCGALGPHKCNLSDLSHSIKEVEIVKEKLSIHGRIATPMLSLLSCISYRQVYWSRKRESAMVVFCAEALKRREEKRERERLQKSAQ